MKTSHYIVKGLVQGVFFRYHTRQVAIGHSIKGTVKNLANGDVEVYAQGEGEDLEKFERFLAVGPSSARVDSLIKEETDTEESYPDFSIIY